MKKRSLTLIVLIFAALMIGIVIYQGIGEDGPIVAGDTMPDLELEMYGEGPQTIHQYAGEIVVLNIWASWCEPCIREMPELMEFAHLDNKVNVVTVNMQTREFKASDAIDFINEQDLDLPVLLDKDGEFLEKVQPQKFPMTYIVDENMIVQEVVTGEVHAKMLQEKVDKLK